MTLLFLLFFFVWICSLYLFFYATKDWLTSFTPAIKNRAWKSNWHSLNWVLRKSTKQWLNLFLRIVELWVSIGHVPVKVELKALNVEVRKSATVESLIKRQSCQLVFDCLQDNVCTPFKGYFTKIEHNINTRNNGCSLKLPKAKLEFGRRSFAFQGALVYNTLPRHLRTLNSRFLFKSNLKQFFQ